MRDRQLEDSVRLRDRPAGKGSQGGSVVLAPPHAVC